MFTVFREVLADERGQGLAEYGLILGLIAVICVIAVTALQVKISAILTKIGNTI
jgi:pilus assembly protein Flp/PilA